MIISILIPACNEADRIARTITAARAIVGVSEIVVVDDGSQDDTASVAEKAGADIVFRQKNAGKGAALNAALQMASGDILLLLDADLEDSAGEGAKLLVPLLEKKADMTIALFPDAGAKGGGMGLVVNTARAGIERLTGRTMQAPLSGQRAVRREVIAACGGFATGWGVEVALTVGALRNRFRVLEVPTEMQHRVTGRSLAGIAHRASQYFAVRRTLAQLTKTYGPPPSP